MILNITILIFGLISHSQEQIIRRYGFIPDRLLSVPSPSSKSISFTDILTRLIASMFIHANIAHLAFNILALAYLGGYAERSVGTLRYIFIYLVAGIAGDLFYGAISTFILGNTHTVLIGASGAISGILGIGCCSETLRLIIGCYFKLYLL